MYDRLTESYGLDEALDELHASRRGGKPHIPTFARRTLERLKALGLRHRTDKETPVNVRPAKVRGTQEVWVRFDTRRDEEQGYMALDVVDVPRSDRAILAAMVAWLAPQGIDFQQVKEAMMFDYSGSYAAEREKIKASIGMEMSGGLPKIRDAESVSRKDLMSAWKELERLETKRAPLKPLQYVLPLLRYYKPDFDSRPPEEQFELIVKTCRYMDEFLGSLGKLQGFLAHGSAQQKKLTAAARDPQRDIRAAVLRDVDGLTNVEIGEKMSVPVDPETLRIKGDHPTVRAMVKRGREILAAAFGDEGWRERVEKMKEEKAAWQLLSPSQRLEIIEREGLELDREYLASDKEYYGGGAAEDAPSLPPDEPG